MSDKEYSILSINGHRETVSLNNGKKYSISPGDSTKCITWYETQRVKVNKTQNHVYKFTLTNLDTSGPDVAEANEI